MAKKHTKKKEIEFEVGFKEHANKEPYVSRAKKDLESLAKDIRVESICSNNNYRLFGTMTQSSYESLFCTRLSYEPIKSSNPRKMLSPEYRWKETSEAVIPKILMDKVDYIRLQKMYSKHA